MKKNFPHRPQVRFLSLVILACAEFLGGCTLSVLAPFYSKVMPSQSMKFGSPKFKVNVIGSSHAFLRKLRTMVLGFLTLASSLPAFSSCK